MSTIRQTAIVARPVVHAVAERPAAQVTSVRSVVALIQPGTSTGGTQTRQLLTITDGQTVFTLSSTPTAPQLTNLYLNGVKANYGTEYTINTTILTWLGITLASTDTLEILY